MSLGKTIFAALGLGGFVAATAYAGVLGLGFTQIKTEYQYSDYTRYTYPSPILFEYPNQDYRQPAPNINDFPENRGLIKITQGLGINDALLVKYQYSQLDEENHQDLFNLKYVRNLSASTEAHVSGQITRGTGGFLGKMIEAGGKVDWAGFVLAEASYAYYSNKVDTAGSSASDAHSLELQLRQALSKTTAFQVKWAYFFAAGTYADFYSNTLSFWVSQWLPTQTAVHLEWRENWNGQHFRSWSPGIEIDQYLGWATLATVRARFYQGLPEDPSQLELLKGGKFESWAFSGILSHHIFAETVVMLKYRYYWSDQDIQMNTYLIALEHIL